jgi:NADPH-dependent curcumin reductase CurA
MLSQEWVLARNPQGNPQTSDFALHQCTLDEPNAGEFIVANHFISADAGVLDRLQRDSYRPRSGLGEVIDGFTVGEVIESRNERFEVGDYVTSGGGWRSHYLSNGKGVMRLDPKIFAPPIGISTAIGVLGVSGLTAYFGLVKVGAVVAGEKVVVSSAAGTVGGTAGQIARILGCRVLGIAGGAERCRHVTDVLGFECRDRHDPEITLPEGIDVYFDNVGGALTDLALMSMNRRGRIVVAGQVSEYGREEPLGIRQLREVVERRIRIEGFVVWDFLSDFRHAMEMMAAWIRDGKLRYTEHITDGFESLPEVFCDLFTHAEPGRSLVRL